MNIYEIKENEQYKLTICYDEFSRIPEGFNDFAIFAVVRNRHFETNTILNSDLIKEIEGNADIIKFPVYAYIHGDIALSFNKYSDRFDSGKCGYVYAFKDKIIAEYGICTDYIIESFKRCCESYLKTYAAYLNGEVFSYTLERKVYCDHCKQYTFENVDSCSGVYDVNFILDDTKKYFQI